MSYESVLTDLSFKTGNLFPGWIPPLDSRYWDKQDACVTGTVWVAPASSRYWDKQDACVTGTD